MILRFVADSPDTHPSLYSLDRELQYWWELQSIGQLFFKTENPYTADPFDVFTDILIPEELI